MENIIKRMEQNRMFLPSRRIKINIQDAKNKFEAYMKYFVELRADKYIKLKEYSEVVEWLQDNKGKGLLLHGDLGRGKSIISNFVIPAILLQELNIIANVYNSVEVNNKVDEAKKKHIIVLDDIGIENEYFDYGNKRNIINEIIDEAERKDKLIIITTNLTGKELVEKYGQRTVDRIIGLTKRIEFKGKSLRI